jgi:hypothetical protein
VQFEAPDLRGLDLALQNVPGPHQR